MEFDWQKQWEQVYARHLAETVERDAETHNSSWRAGGRTKTRPEGEDFNYWLANGAQFAKNWAEFRESKTDWELWYSPDGVPGIELYMEPIIGGVKVKAIPDRIYRTPEGNICIDLKAGRRKPNAGYQLAIYRRAFQLCFDEDIIKGYYFMNRKGELLEDYSPVVFDADLIDKAFADAKALIANEVFLPNPGDQCKICGVRSACAMAGGSL